MKKGVTFVLAFVCFLALAGCYDVRTIDLGQVSSIELHSGLTGDVLEISDPETVQKITDPIRGLTFQAYRSISIPNGYAYAIIWMNEEGESIGRIQVLDKEGSNILYGGHCYRVKGDQTIDTGYLQQLLEETDKVDITEPVADTWGVTLTLENITASGATLVINHSGDAPGEELLTGSFYCVERWQDGAWCTVPEIPLDDGVERTWTSEGWLIPLNGSRENEVKWINLYGELPAGQYRLGKEIMLFRGPGDYEERPCYVEFRID